ncbi:MAG: carbon-monoxide dehydrogenase medium subunit [Chloroflexi bacterium]|jgi:carbon-monoxide dehydrogenase medium subunit|nr:MAG: carbon-monoxide dehydrogenase medium subunit [Chloroflexota bacterium]
MRGFEFHAPSTLKEVHNLLAQHGENAKLIAGGTGLVLMMKQQLVVPDHVISLANVAELSGIASENGSLRIGALTTHRTLEMSDVALQGASLLHDTYKHVATIRIREVATVGGALTHADPAQDSPPALLALGASVKLANGKGERTVDLADFFEDYYTTVTEPDEVLTEVIVPKQSASAGAAFLKFLPRTADDYATVCVAAVLDVDASGKCQSVGIALGAAGPTPIRATDAEAVLQGQQVTPEAIREAAETVRAAVDPTADIRGSKEYKTDMSVVFTRRALEQAFANARS